MVGKYIANNTRVSLSFLLHLKDQGTIMELGADAPSGQLHTRWNNITAFSQVESLWCLKTKSVCIHVTKNIHVYFSLYSQ